MNRTIVIFILFGVACYALGGYFHCKIPQNQPALLAQPTVSESITLWEEWEEIKESGDKARIAVAQQGLSVLTEADADALNKLANDYFSLGYNAAYANITDCSKKEPHEFFLPAPAATVVMLKM